MRPTDNPGTFTGKTVRFLQRRTAPLWISTTAFAGLFIILALVLIAILLS